MIKTIEPEWDCPAGVAAHFTTRIGGVSEAPYDSFNLALHVGDDAGRVAQNRRLLSTSLELDSEPCWIEQTHSISSVNLALESKREADAAVTRQPGQIAVVMVADCLPVLLANRDGSEVGAVHAGWRGLQSGVIQSALAKMQSNPGSLLAWIGPAISQPNFEVGDEVRSAFVATTPAAADYFVANSRGRWLCDLAGIARIILQQAGVNAVYCDPHCSYRDRELFYSYRRENICGRQAALIWIK